MLYFSHISLKEGNESMATKKTSQTTKKAVTKKPVATKAPTANTTKVRTVTATATPKRSIRALNLNRSPLIGAAVAEFIGTFLLAAVFIAGQGQPILILFALAGIVLTIGAVSGAHINPIVTIGAWVTRRINVARAATYLVAQVLGAMLALVVLTGFVNQAPTVTPEMAAFGQTAATLYSAVPLPEDKQWAVLFAELLGATILGLAVASALRAKEKLTAAFTYGFGFFTALLIAGSAAVMVGGTAILNPAVAISLQAFSDFNFWVFAVYALAPVLGGIIGFALSDLIHGTTSRNDA